MLRLIFSLASLNYNSRWFICWFSNYIFGRFCLIPMFPKKFRRCKYSFFPLILRLCKVVAKNSCLKFHDYSYINC